MSCNRTEHKLVLNCSAFVWHCLVMLFFRYDKSLNGMNLLNGLASFKISSNMPRASYISCYQNFKHAVYPAKLLNHTQKCLSWLTSWLMCLCLFDNIKNVSTKWCLICNWKINDMKIIYFAFLCKTAIKNN